MLWLLHGPVQGGRGGLEVWSSEGVKWACTGLTSLSCLEENID